MHTVSMTITGVHALLYTSEPGAVRAIFRDVLGWDHVDDGDGWLIFALPPAELGVHPSPPHRDLTPCSSGATSRPADRSQDMSRR
ncbi:hypothetical protein BH23ACT3_BH23ACT3_07660 [soil metagenome]